MAAPGSVDEYIEAAPDSVRPMLREIRRLILDAVPTATEQIAYGMPTYRRDGEPLVNFAAAKAHVAVYGLVHEDGDVPAELAPYLHHRSTLRFAFGHPLPTAALSAALRRKAGGD